MRVSRDGRSGGGEGDGDGDGGVRWSWSKRCEDFYKVMKTLRFML